MLVIDKNFGEDALRMVDFLNNKMVTDIEITIDSFTTKYGIAKNNLTFKITTLHMEYGKIEKWFYIENFIDFNRDSLIDAILSHFTGCSGVKYHYIHVA